MSEKEGVPAAQGDKIGTVSDRFKSVIETSRYSRPSLLNFSSRHSLLVFKVVTANPGSTIAEIQDLAGFHRGLPANMEARREISRCCEVLTFFRYFEKRGYRFYPTGKQPLKEPRVIGSDGLPRVRMPSTATMPEYARPL